MFEVMCNKVLKNVYMIILLDMAGFVSAVRSRSNSSSLSETAAVAAPDRCCVDVVTGGGRGKGC